MSAERPQPSHSHPARQAPSTDVPADLVELGRVIGAHGIRGAIKISPYGPAADSVLRKGGRWWLTDVPPAAAKALKVTQQPWLADISNARVQVDLIVAELDGVADRDIATALKSTRVWISRAAFPAAGDDEYYWVDLIGCAVVDPQDLPLGVVSAVEEYGADPVLRVLGPDAVDRLIPFVEATIRSVDLPQRRIVADWGLDY